MTDKAKQRPKYELQGGWKIPKIKRGRHKSLNNDGELVKLGVKGIIDGDYKTYIQAGRDLAPRTRERVTKRKDGKIIFEDVKSAMSNENIARRLARKISEAHKLKPYG